MPLTSLRINHPGCMSETSPTGTFKWSPFKDLSEALFLQAYQDRFLQLKEQLKNVFQDMHLTLTHFRVYIFVDL